MKEECFICEGFTTTNESWLFQGAEDGAIEITIKPHIRGVFCLDI